MQLNENDKAYIWDMFEASKDILEFIHGLSFHEFENNKMLRFAVERQLMVIGEAANHVPKETQILLSDVPWKAIIGLRNIIAHDYGDILTTRIWKISVNNVPELKAVLEPLLKE